MKESRGFIRGTGTVDSLTAAGYEKYKRDYDHFKCGVALMPNGPGLLNLCMLLILHTVRVVLPDHPFESTLLDFRRERD